MSKLKTPLTVGPRFAESGIYGAVTSGGVLFDCAVTLQGAKCYATRNKYTQIGRRVGYNIVATWTKTGGRWVQD